jgi:hypothetical protein
MAKAKKASSGKSSKKKAPTRPAAKAKSAKTSSTKKPAKKTTLKKTERKSAVKPAPKTVAKTAAAKPASAAAKPVTKAVAANAPIAKKPLGKKAPAIAPPGMLTIDTNLAAQNAAAMVFNRPVVEGSGGASSLPEQPAKESSTFKNLKDQLANPKPTGLGNLFGSAGDQKKSGGHFNPHQEKGHNQTFGGMNKTGVPRRTNG